MDNATAEQMITDKISEKALYLAKANYKDTREIEVWRLGYEKGYHDAQTDLSRSLEKVITNRIRFTNGA